jgi:putative acetyltransferase
MARFRHLFIYQGSNILHILPESPSHIPQIAETVRLAFNSDAEPRLISLLRSDPSAFIPQLSLVAEEDGQVIGHILFSRITIQTASASISALSLAPLAVHPAHQRQGIGAALTRHGLDECRRLGHAIVIVLGHPNYYPRFGFSAALAQPLACPFGNPGPAWMALEIVPGALNGVSGTVVYPTAFAAVS